MSILRNDRAPKEERLVASIKKQQNVCKLVAEIDRSLHYQLKKFSLENGLSIKQIVNEALKKYIKL
jgi:hypothetical protein